MNWQLKAARPKIIEFSLNQRQREEIVLFKLQRRLKLKVKICVSNLVHCPASNTCVTPRRPIKPGEQSNSQWEKYIVAFV